MLHKRIVKVMNAKITAGKPAVLLAIETSWLHKTQKLVLFCAKTKIKTFSDVDRDSLRNSLKAPILSWSCQKTSQE